MYMGNFILVLTDKASVVASDNLWVEDAAIQQLKVTSSLPGMVRAVGLPDLHPGRGYPVGAAFLTSDRIYPALIGGDIGCGVSLYQTDIAVNKVKIDKIDRRIGSLDQGVSAEELDDLLKFDPRLADEVEAVGKLFHEAGISTAHLSSLGTCGFGNHFIELQKTEQVFDQAAFDSAKLSKSYLQLVVHSGSRGLGQAILREHVDAYGHQGLKIDDLMFFEYMRKHDAALKFAELNRKVIASRVAHRIRCSVELVADVNHNLVARSVIDGVEGWVHRKGATPTDQGIVMLPGSRDDFSFVLQPIDVNADVSLRSIAHGAGRKWMRSDCKGKINKKIVQSDLLRNALGSRVICNDKALVYEEAGQAYKEVGDVMTSLEGAGLVRSIAKSRPVLTYKTRGECC
jgi:release factor H-coupled RctB family protein